MAGIILLKHVQLRKLTESNKHAVKAELFKMQQIFFWLTAISFLTTSWSIQIAPFHYLEETNLSAVSSKLAKQYPHQSQKLNEDFLPTHYAVELKIILPNKPEEDAGIPGRLRVFGVNQRNSSKIVMHAGSLEVNGDSVTVTSNAKDGRQLPVKSCYRINNLFVIQLRNEIGSGEELEIYMEYLAVLNADYYGLRSEDYFDESAREMKQMVVTQLGSLSARDSSLDSRFAPISYCDNVFPCIDEPHLKTTFELTIIRRADQISVSNTEKLSSTPHLQDTGFVVDKFAPTIKMTAHNFAFVVGDFSYVELHFGTQRKPLWVYAPKNQIKKAQFRHIAQISSEMLTFYEEYFGTSANLPKMDLIFGPTTLYSVQTWGVSYFNYRASQHGLLTRAGDNIIPRGKNTTAFNVVETISPALTKQWMGEMWSSNSGESFSLKEPIAEFTEFYLGWNAIDPNLTEARILVELQSAQIKDAEYIEHQKDYKRKGAPLIRMVEGFLTKEGFRDGLREYFCTRAQKETSLTNAEFFSILQDAAGDRNMAPNDLSVREILESYLKNTGFPLVRVGVENGTHFKLTQEKFLAKEEKSVLWYVPIRMQIGNETTQVWLKPDGNPLYVAGNTLEIAWIDPEVTGYYRIFYEDELLPRIETQLKLNASNFSSLLARSRLLLDYLTFADKGLCSYETALNLSSYLSLETEPGFTVWWAFLWKMRTEVVRPFLGHPEYHIIHNYFSSKLDPLFLQVSAEDPSAYKTFLMHWLLKYSCQFQTSYCVNLAHKVFLLWQSKPNSALSSFSGRFTGISANTMECVIVASVGKPAFDFIRSKYAGKKFPPSLTCAKDPELIQEILQKLVDPLNTKFSSNHRQSLLSNLIDSDGRTKVLPFLSNNFDSVVKLIGKDDVEVILNFLYKLANYYSTSEQLKQLDEFVEVHQKKLQGYRENLRKIYGRVEKKIAWMESNGRDILDWVNTHQQPFRKVD